MWKAEITKINKNEVFGICQSAEYKIDVEELNRPPKKGDIIEGRLAGGSIIAEKYSA